MASAKAISTESAELRQQRQYTKTLREKGFDFGLVIADAFVRGIRDIGYKSTATAIDELIDNALQAGAANVHVIFGFGSGSEAKPDRVAVLDDGHGMDPDMIRAAIIWGGTHRENDRAGFGRYGYGLPSACVSQGRSLTVYSLVEGGHWHRVMLDLDLIGKGGYAGDGGQIVVPEAKRAQLPDFVAGYMKEHSSQRAITHGTVIVIEKLDRLSWTTKTGLERNLLEHFGVVYRNFMSQAKILVHGKQVDPVDPLFTTPGYRHYDLDEDRAEPLESTTFEVKDQDTRKAIGVVRVRYAYFPPTFPSLDKSKPAAGKNANARLGVMRDHNGIIVLRNGRQIDVVTRCEWTDFLTNDRYWGVEVDFPATVDEEFSITTSKQQVILSTRMWDLLKEADVWKAIQQLRRRHGEDGSKLRERRETDPAARRASEMVMEDAEKFKTRRPGGEPVIREKESKERLEQEIRRRARESELPMEEAERQLIAEIQGRPYKVRSESLPGAPFFRMAQIGGQKVLYLNTSHRFYTDVYTGPESTPRLRAALELLLWVIGDCELSAVGDRRLFYETARAEWSEGLLVALDRLSQISSMEDEVTTEETQAGETTEATPAGVGGDTASVD